MCKQASARSSTTQPTQATQTSKTTTTATTSTSTTWPRSVSHAATCTPTLTIVFWSTRRSQRHLLAASSLKPKCWQWDLQFKRRKRATLELAIKRVYNLPSCNFVAQTALVVECGQREKERERREWVELVVGKQKASCCSGWNCQVDTSVQALRTHSTSVCVCACFSHSQCVCVSWIQHARERTILFCAHANSCCRCMKNSFCSAWNVCECECFFAFFAAAAACVPLFVLATVATRRLSNWLTHWLTHSLIN